MPISPVYRALRQIALRDFSDIVLQAHILFLQTGDPHKLRIDIVDGSLLDVFVSVRSAARVFGICASQTVE